MARKTTVKKVTTELPYNLDAERVVLGSAMLSKDYCLDILNTLEEDDFFAGKHQIMFRAISSLSVRGVDVDVLTVAEELANLKELENIGGAKYLAECTNTVVAASTLDFYIRIIQDNSVLRKMLNTIRDIDKEYRTEEIENINDFILDSENRFKESIAKRHISSFETTHDIAPRIEEALEKVSSSDAAKYKANLDAYDKKLSELDKKYEEMVKGARLDTMVVCDRYPFRYLAEDYKLKYSAAFVGCSAETEASFETVKFLADKVKALDSKAVLIIDNSDGKLAKTVLETAGKSSVKVEVLDSMQSCGADLDYIKTMTENLEKLKTALS